MIEPPFFLEFPEFIDGPLDGGRVPVDGRKPPRCVRVLVSTEINAAMVGPNPIPAILCFNADDLKPHGRPVHTYVRCDQGHYHHNSVDIGQAQS